MKFEFISVWLVLCLAISCGHEHGAKESPYLFSGDCSVEIVSQTEGAEILLDGIHLGEGQVLAAVPCGEKKVTVKKHGYVTYEQYLPVTLKDKLKVTVELNKLKRERDYALSEELIAFAKNPPKVVAKEAGQSWGAAVGSGAQGAATGSGAEAAAKTYNSVEDWR